MIVQGNIDHNVCVHRDVQSKDVNELQKIVQICNVIMEKAQKLKVSKNDRCIESSHFTPLALFSYEHWVAHLCLLGL